MTWPLSRFHADARSAEDILFLAIQLPALRQLPSAGFRNGFGFVKTVGFHKALVCVLSGARAGLASVLLTARLNSAQPIAGPAEAGRSGAL